MIIPCPVSRITILFPVYIDSKKEIFVIYLYMQVYAYNRRAT